MARLPTVAIVGRPNVGKSTLFNRLGGKRLALVDDRPGVTRDRREGDATLLGLEFRVIDTAGYEDEDPATLPGRMRAQTVAAVREADAALFLVDGRAGIMPLDEEIARWLRSESTPVILAANKAEGRAAEAGLIEAYALGLGEPIADCRLILCDQNDVAIYVANIHYHKSCFSRRLDLLQNSGPRKGRKQAKLKKSA